MTTPQPVRYDQNQESDFHDGGYMYCPNCDCNYIGAIASCPICGIHLLSEPPGAEPDQVIISYEELVQRVKKNYGKIEIALAACEVGMRRSYGFPYFGFGFAWTKRMQGKADGIQVNLNAREIIFRRRRQFPFRGFGFAWVNRFDGMLNGNEFSLVATNIAREKKWNFPYFGYGYAWTEELHGECGEELSLTCLITGVGRKHQSRFPWLGYGYAWEKDAILTVAGEGNLPTNPQGHKRRFEEISMVG